MLTLILTLLLCVIQVSSFCYMNEVSGVKIYMLLHSKPTTLILMNHFIDKYAKTSGVSAEKIRLCIQKKTKTNLRG